MAIPKKGRIRLQKEYPIFSEGSMRAQNHDRKEDCKAQAYPT